MIHRQDEIEQYVAEGLPPGGEARLRAHLAECADCRASYERQLDLLRALAGEPDQPTPDEEVALRRRVLAELGTAPAVPWGERIRAWLDANTIIGGRPWIAGAVAAALLTVLGVAVTMLILQPVRIGQVARADGATVGETPAAAEREIYDGQLIRVSGRGLAIIDVDGVGTVRVYPGSELVFPDSPRGLELLAGKIWCLVEPGADGFLVRTPEAAARVVGTSFVVERRGAATDVRVMGGEVAVEDAGGQGEVRVGEGRRTRVTAGAAPARPRRYVADGDRGEWDRSFDRLLRQVQRDIQTGLDSLREALP